jgi:thymidylate synthase (FAD)
MNEHRAGGTYEEAFPDGVGPKALQHVLDHGYIKLIEHWGADEAIIEAARMSTQKGFLGWGPRCSECDFAKGDMGEEHEAGCSQPDKWVPGDEKLLRYLYENAHATPFEFAGLTVEVQAPIMVFREWHRHRVPFGYNEASARYAPLPDLNYIPSVERLMMNSKTNKQAGAIKGAEELTQANAEWFQEELQRIYDRDELLYQDALKRGVPKELARVHLPVGRYSRMRATGNLRGWLAFLTLRMAPNAQFEIRQYANEIGKLIEQIFPRTWELFAAGRPA